MEMKKVLCVDGLGEFCEEILKANGIHVTSRPNMDVTSLIEEIPDYDGLMVHASTRVTKEVVDAGTKLTVIGCASGRDNKINVLAAAEKNIQILCSTEGNAVSGAEIICCMILALARKLVAAAEILRQGRWETVMGSEVKLKTLAIIGLGIEGQQLAMRMSTFGMSLIGYDPLMSEEECLEYQVTKMELDDLWYMADYIAVTNSYLGPAGAELINENMLSRCKYGVKIVINVSRSGIVNEHDLLEALDDGMVSGAALQDHNVSLTLLQHPLVIVTPYFGAYTPDSLGRIGADLAHQVLNVLNPVLDDDVEMCTESKEVQHACCTP